MKPEKMNLRRKIYRLVAQHARTLDNLQDVYTAVMESVGDEISFEEAEARVRAALGTFDQGEIPNEVSFPFISVLDKACSGQKEDCLCTTACEHGTLRGEAGAKPTIKIADCISCGLCIVACPEGAIADKTEIAQTINLIKKHRRVYAILAPAFSGQFGPEVREEQVKTALLMLGFYDVIEVALGADMITMKEAEEFLSRMDRGDKFMITSCCCPPFVRMAKSFQPKISGMVSDTVSPMVATARFIKAEDPDAKVVFIGPCIAKKTEAKLPDLKDAVDTVLTFEELNAIFEAFKLDLSTLEVEVPVTDASHDGRIYARTGGVSHAITTTLKALRPDIKLTVRQGNGIKECKKILLELAEGDTEVNFIEGMACVGGCVGGPGRLVPPEIGSLAVEDFAKKSGIRPAVDNVSAKTLVDKYKDIVKLESDTM